MTKKSHIMTSDIPSLGLFNLLNAASKPAPKIPTLEELGAAMDIPDDKLFANLRAAGFIVGAPAPPLDRDLMEAAENQEDWWRGEAP